MGTISNKPSPNIIFWVFTVAFAGLLWIVPPRGGVIPQVALGALFVITLCGWLSAVMSSRADNIKSEMAPEVAQGKKGLSSTWSSNAVFWMFAMAFSGCLFMLGPIYFPDFMQIGFFAIFIIAICGWLASALIPERLEHGGTVVNPHSTTATESNRVPEEERTEA